MLDFGVNLGRSERKMKKNPKTMNKNLNDLKPIFLELVHLGLYSGKVWENRFFLSCITAVDPYSKLLLNLNDQIYTITKENKLHDFISSFHHRK